MNITNFGIADDTHVAGNPDTKKIVVHFKKGNEALGLAIDAPTAAKLIQQLAQTLISAPILEMSQYGQILGIHKLSAQMPHPNLPTLKYELECGVQMETTIEGDNLRTLHRQLTDIVNALDDQSLKPAH